MWKDLEIIIQKARKEPWAKAYTAEDFWQHLSAWVKEQILPDFLTQFSSQVENLRSLRG
jgi:hypothetical protein